MSYGDSPDEIEDARLMEVGIKRKLAIPTVEQRAAILNARHRLQCTALQLEAAIGIEASSPIGDLILEAAEACDEKLKEE